MSAQLGKKVKASARKAGLNYRQVATQAKVPYGWVRQVAAGGIDRPDPERLAAVARATGGDLNEWLALSNQLGSAAGLTAPDDLAAAIRAQTEAITALVNLVRPLVEQAQERTEARLRALEAIATSLAPRVDAGSGGRSARPSTAV